MGGAGPQDTRAGFAEIRVVRHSRAWVLRPGKSWRVWSGFCPFTVFGWMARYREGGLDVPQSSDHNRVGQKKLSGPQLRQIYTLIVGNDPRQLSFEFALWTRIEEVSSRGEF